METAAAAGLLWFGLFSLTGFWLWILIGAWIVMAIADIHYERLGWAGFWLLAFVACLHFGGVIDVASLVIHEPLKFFGGVGGYILIGLGWGALKLKFRARKIRVKLNEEVIPGLRHRFLQSKGIAGDTVPANLRDEWRAYQDEDYGFTERLKSMEVSQNKAHLTMWVIWWPISAFWTAVSDWVVHFFDWLIYDVFGNFYKAIVAREQAKINRD